MTILRIINLKNKSVFFLMLYSVLFVSAQTSGPAEYQVKAVFLYNFAQFVEWPQTAFATEQSPIIIGILGDNPFGSYVENVVSGENVNGHPLVVYHYKNIGEIKTCHILFIDRSEISNLNNIITRLKGKNVLTVSDAPNFLQQGGMVKFVTKNSKINIQMNLDNIKADNLMVSSKLLRIAEIVSTK
jgi:hypothetical protein